MFHQNNAIFYELVTTVVNLVYSFTDLPKTSVLNNTRREIYGTSNNYIII